MTDEDARLDETEAMRREALGAFAHEIRTPLTSIRMVLELARRAGEEGELRLDRELAEMLTVSIDDLQTLADDLQELSRLERGKVALSPGPCELPAAVAAATELLGQAPRLECEAVDEVAGPWDAARLVRALAGFARSANRIGDGSGVVRLRTERAEGSVRLWFESGTLEGPQRPIQADAGFAFFRSRQLVVAMGGSVHCDRRDRAVQFGVVLPLHGAQGGESSRPA